MELTEFLLARIAEDEVVAKACVGINELAAHINGTPIPRWERDGSQVRSADERRIVRVGHTWAREAEHIARHDPARVLAECEAKRRIVELAYQTDPTPSAWGGVGYSSASQQAINETLTEDVLPLLALPYADHPDYREEWRP